MTLANPTLHAVLRMSGPATLGVVAALNEVGIRAWAPQSTAEKRSGSSRKRTTVTSALLPTFVFADYAQLDEILAFRAKPVMGYEVYDHEQKRMVRKGCPYFSIMRYDGRYISVPDRSLDTMRVAEQRGRPIVKGKTFKDGEAVCCPDAGFDGVPGQVLLSRGKHALVLFAGFTIPITVPNDRLFSAA